MMHKIWKIIDTWYGNVPSEFYKSTQESKEYCLVDCEKLIVFAEVLFSELSQISTISKNVKECKPFKYRVSKERFGNCLAVRNDVIERFFNTNQVIKVLSNRKRNNIRVVLGSNPGRKIVVSLIESIELNQKHLWQHSCNAGMFINPSAFKQNVFIDSRQNGEYAGLKALLMEKKILDLLEINDKRRTSNLMLYLNEYMSDDLTRSQAIKLIGEELLVRFDQTPKENKYSFIKQLGKYKI